MKYILLTLSMIFFLACSEQEQAKGAAKMHWDRDMCSRCVMVISDRKNSVQVYMNETKKTYKFDDIGCMVLFADEEKIDIFKDSRILITDVKTGEWIDARAAFFTSKNTTPMGFGFSAYKSKKDILENESIFSFDEVIKRIN